MSNLIQLTGYSQTGAACPLPQPVSLQLSRAVDSPADGLELTLPLPQDLPPLCKVKAQLPGDILFIGEVDEEERVSSPKGELLSLFARSDGALLLDNQALPQRFDSPRLQDVYQRYIAPYGFPIAGFGELRLPSYRVSKGASEWEAFCGFCEGALGVRPYLTPQGVIEPQRPSGGRRYTIGEGGLAYQKLTFRRERSRVLSKICIRGEEGYYSSAVSSEKAQEIGVRRKRYWIPPDEYQHNPQTGADRLLMDAWNRYRQAEALLPDLLPLSLADRFDLIDPIGAETGYYPVEIRWEFSASGAFTRLYLRKE